MAEDYLVDLTDRTVDGVLRVCFSGLKAVELRISKPERCEHFGSDAKVTEAKAITETVTKALIAFLIGTPY